MFGYKCAPANDMKNTLIMDIIGVVLQIGQTKSTFYGWCEIVFNIADSAMIIGAISRMINVFFLAGMTVIDVIGSLGYYIFLLLLMALVAALLGSQPMVFFLNDALRLLTGPIPPLRLGPIDFAPLVALLALGALESVLGMGLLFLTHGVAHVV